MIKIRFVLIGKVKDSYLKEGYSEYLKRLSRYADVRIEYVEEEKLPDGASSSEIRRALDNEAVRVLSSLKNQDTLYLCDLHGKELDSPGFAASLQKQIDSGASSLVFVVGSSYGLSDLLRKKAKERYCFSKLTFTHPMTLLVALEQVYRAFKINSNETYQK